MQLTVRKLRTRCQLVSQNPAHFREPIRFFLCPLLTHPNPKLEWTLWGGPGSLWWEQLHLPPAVSFRRLCV
jgi:hypothetical protein